MLTDKEVKHIAGLARIKISAKEEKSLKKDLSSILEYIDKLNEVNTDKVEPLYQTTRLVDSFPSYEPKRKHMLAGWRTEPPVSEPRAKTQRSAATAEAEPPEEPPGTRVKS